MGGPNYISPPGALKSREGVAMEGRKVEPVSGRRRSGRGDCLAGGVGLGRIPSEKKSEDEKGVSQREGSDALGVCLSGIGGADAHGGDGS